MKNTRLKHRVKKTNILKGLKNRVEEASTRKNPDFINPIISNFFFGFTYMTPETELQMAEMLLPQLNTEAINQILKESFTGEHLTIIYSGIDKQDQVHPTEAQLLSLVNEVKTADIKANAAATISSAIPSFRPSEKQAVDNASESSPLLQMTVTLLSSGRSGYPTG